MKASIKGEIVQEYLKKYAAYESKRIARIITAEMPEVFPDIESTRTLIRYYRGALGEANRQDLTPESFVPRIQAPPCEEPEWRPYELKTEDFPILAGGDLHIPYHDQDILEMFIEHGIRTGARTVLLAGDWIDFYLVSHFQKDPRKRSTVEELDILCGVLELLHKHMPEARIVYKLGNHEERFDAHLMNAAPELFKLPELHLSAILMQRCPFIEIVDNRRVIHVNGLNIIHGHEYTGGVTAPVNPARGLFMRAKKSSMCFHFHQTSEHSEPTIEDKLITTWSVGCMCERHPLYSPLNKWNHGFADITLDDDLLFNVHNHRIVHYKLM